MLNSFYDKFIFTNGLKFKNFNFSLSKIPMVFVPVDLLKGMFVDNSDNENIALYYSLKNSFIKNFSKRFDETFFTQGKRTLKLLRDLFQYSGFGKITVINFDEKNLRAIIALEYSPFAVGIKKRKGHKVDHFIRAVLAASFCEAFGKDFECVEKKCMAEGEPNCEFIVKRKEEFSKDSEISKKQLRFSK